MHTAFSTSFQTQTKYFTHTPQRLRCTWFKWSKPTW